jgi:hypothetical protein
MTNSSTLRPLVHLIAFVVVVAVLGMNAQTAEAQTCDPGRATIHGSVNVGDGSDPTLWASPGVWGWLNGTYTTANPASGVWGAQDFRLTAAGNWTFTFQPSQGYYFPINQPQPGASCTTVAGCLECDGQYSFTAYAVMGTFSGRVWELPTGAPKAFPSVFAFSVDLNQGAGGAQWGDAASGYYKFHDDGLRGANNWGIAVFGDGMRAGEGKYILYADRIENGTHATTTSSKNVTVDLTVWKPGFEEPSTRGGGSCSGSGNAGGR